MNVTEAFKTDFAHVGDLVRTASGDLGRISGLANLEQALFHRLITMPGSLVHRPTYGVGMPFYQNSICSFVIQQKIAAIIQEQFKQDPRVQEVTKIAIDVNDAVPSRTVIKVFVKPVGYTESEMVFTPFSGGGGL